MKNTEFPSASRLLATMPLYHAMQSLWDTSAVIVVDSDGVIVQSSIAVEIMFEWKQGELIGRSINELIPQRYHNQHAGHFAEFLKSPGIRPMNQGLRVLGAKKTGEEIKISITLANTGYAGNNYTIANITK